MKRLLKRSLVIGAGVTVGFIVLGFVFTEVAALRTAGEKIMILLYPGTALVLASGNKRIDDVDFWGLAMLLNWLLYSLICFLVLWLIGRWSANAGRSESE